MGEERTAPDAAERFAVTVEFELVDGGHEAFYPLIRENAETSLQVEVGCRRFDVLLPSPEERDKVFLYEIYDSRADFDKHVESSHYKEFDRKSRDLVKKKTAKFYSVHGR